MIVDRGIGAPPDRTGQRHRARPLTLAPHQQLRAGGEEGGLAATDGKHVAGGKLRAQQAEDRPGVVVTRGVHLHLPGKHHLLELVGADPLHRPLHRLLVM